MKIGSEVLCIDGKRRPTGSEKRDKIMALATFPEAGKIYTIREIRQMSNGQIGVCVEEITNPTMMQLANMAGFDVGEGNFDPTWLLELGFDINRFVDINVDKEEIEEEIESKTHLTFKKL